MTLKQQLESVGLDPDDAQALSDEYDAEPDFFVGLEQVAEVVSSGQKPRQAQLTPPGEPWRSIYTHILGNGTGPRKAFEIALDAYDDSLAWAIGAAVTLQIDYLRTRSRVPGKKRPASAEYIRALKQLGYSFRMNELSDKVEINDAPIDDPLAAKIRTQMRDAGYQYVNVFEDAYTAHAWDNRYHPIRDYLLGLKYDGGGHIAHLAGHFADRDGVFALWLRRWLIGAVARVYTGSQNPMLVLDGPQNIGKSFFAQWLCPLSEYFIEAPINPDDKDNFVRLASKWVWEVSELGATTRKADREALKSFITVAWVTVRKAYDRHDMEKPPLASFIGTVNNESGILSDPTGSRRFVIAHLDAVDWSYSQMNVGDIWAEAHAAYLAGEPWRLTPDEAKRAAEINEGYEIEDPLEGMIKQLFVIDPALTGWLPTVDILQELELAGLKGSTVGNARMLATTMTRLGLERKRKRNVQQQLVWGYEGIARITNVP